MSGTIRTIEIDVCIPDGYEYVRYDHAAPGEWWLDDKSIARLWTGSTKTIGRYVIVRKVPQYREPCPGDEGKEIEVLYGDQWQKFLYVGRMSNGAIVYESMAHHIYAISPERARILVTP